MQDEFEIRSNNFSDTETAYNLKPHTTKQHPHQQHRYTTNHTVDQQPLASQQMLPQWTINDEIDLEDMLHHIPKLKGHISKMHYLDDKQKYVKKIRSQGRSALGNEHQCFKFQFLDLGFLDTSLIKSKVASSSSSVASVMDINNYSSLVEMDSNVSESKVDGSAVDINNLSINANISDMSINDIGTLPNVYSASTSIVHTKKYISTTFNCHVYFPHQFRALRKRLYGNDENYVESLSRCSKWKASGIFLFSFFSDFVKIFTKY